MAVIALTAEATSNRMIDVVQRPSHANQITRPAAEAIVAGAPIRQDTTSGRWTNANGTTSGEARATHIALRTVGAGESLTGARNFLMGGLDLDALAFDAPVYLSDTDGRLDTAAGTVSVIVGRVVPAFATLLGTGPDKLLDVGSFGH